MDIKYRGQPVQFGGEKEFNLKSLKGDKGHLEHTQQPVGWQPDLLGQVSADMVKPGVAAGPNVRWADLNDKGKAQYALAHKARTGKFPVIKTTPNPDYKKIDFEPNGWIEVVSPPFDIGGIQNFVDNYGWGHIHTSFMRGAPPAEQKQMLNWVANANLYSFLNSLEHRNFSVNGDDGWRFTVTGLSIPTEQHMERWGQILAGQNLKANPFGKHTIINVRGNGKQYGHRDRIGTEMRGGSKDEKVRIMNSQLSALSGNGWGAQPAAYDADGFRLASVPETPKGRTAKYGYKQVKRLPRDFQTLMSDHIRAHPDCGVTEADAQRIFAFVDAARFHQGKKASRIDRFDQRACTPLLSYEGLPFLSDAERGRAVEARTWFLQQMSELSKQGNLSPRDKAIKSAELMTNWAKQAKLADAFGRWLDGPEPQQHLRG